MIKKFLRKSIAFAFAFCCMHQPTEAGLFNPKTFKLDNGLTVVVVENHRAPIATQFVWYKIGSADDPDHARGVAHYLEHLMFKGPEGSLSKDVTKIIERLGGVYNATTASDYTNYYEVVASDKIEDMMKIEAERMKSLVIQEEEARRELDVILEERKSRFESNPVGQFIEAIHAVWFWNHPYGRSGIGWESEIKSLTPQKARDFYRNWYGPNNAVLIYTGDVYFDEIKAKVKKHFGGISERALAKRIRAVEPPHNGISQRMVMHSENIAQPFFLLVQALPRFSNDLSRSYATQVLSYLLSEGPTSYLYQQLIEKEKVASFIKYDTPYLYALDPSFGALIAQPAHGVAIEHLEKKLNQVLLQKKKKGFTTEEVEKAKRRLLASLVYLRDNNLGGANELGIAMMIGLPLEEVEAWPERIKAVKSEDVNNVFNTIFFNKEHLIGYLLPEEKSSKHDQK